MVQTQANKAGWYAVQLRQGAYRRCNAGHGKDAGIAVIVVLGLLGSPHAVIWRVSLIRVGALYRVLPRWLVAHVREKRLKRVYPPLTDGYPSTPVILVLRGIWGKAAPFHRAPTVVFR